MYLKKRGTALISTMVILALMSTLGCFMFKMMENNNELSSVYELEQDKYDLDKNEEKILYEFMKKLNEGYKTNTLNEENNSKDSIFSNDFEMKIEDSTLDYNKNNDKLFLITKKYDDKIRKREIEYSIKNNKIILIPTYKF